MANEITVSGSLSYADSESASVALSLPAALLKSITTKRYHYGKLSVGTTDTTINLGSVTSLGYALFINRDPSNPIDIKTGAAGTIIARLDATNGFCFLKFGSGITAPVAIATTAPCQMEYLLLSA